MNKKEHLQNVLEEIRKKDFPEIPQKLVDEILKIQTSVESLSPSQVPSRRSASSRRDGNATRRQNQTADFHGLRQDPHRR